MGAPKGNKFWELRSKHGRDKLFATPELMWEAACEYFQWCEDNPLMEATIVKGTTLDLDTGVSKPYDIAELPKMRPYTYQGLCGYLGCNTEYFNQFKRNLEPGEKDFSRVLTRIADVIYRQKFEGAASGFLNPNIIARDLGLTDKSDITSKGNQMKAPVIMLSKDNE